MPTKKKSHEEFRKCVCLLCFRKGGKDLRPISDKDRGIIEEHFVKGLSSIDNRLPNVICLTCKFTMQRTSQSDTSRTIPPFDYSLLKELKPATRSSHICDCFICKIGRSTPFNKENYVPSMSPGRPLTTQNAQTPIKLCPTA